MVLLKHQMIFHSSRCDSFAVVGSVILFMVVLRGDLSLCFDVVVILEDDLPFVVTLW